MSTSAPVTTRPSTISRLNRVSDICLMLGGITSIAGGATHPGDSGEGNKVQQLHEMLVQPSWYRSHALLLLSMGLVAAGIFAISRRNDLRGRLIHVFCVLCGLRFSPGGGGFGGEAFGQVVDHRDGDHASRVVGSGFVVADEAAAVHEPADGAFDRPAAFDDAEAFGVWVFGDDLDVDAQGCAVFDELVFQVGSPRVTGSTRPPTRQRSRARYRVTAWRQAPSPAPDHQHATRSSDPPRHDRP